MATDITGGNNQVGTSNRQFINSNNNITINVNINCSECHQHQHKEGISIPGEDIHGVFDSLQKIALSGRHTKPVTAVSAKQQQTEAAIKSHIDPALQRKADGHVMKPGDWRWYANGQSIYVGESNPTTDPTGDGYFVHFDEDSKTVVKQKLNMKLPLFRFPDFNPWDREGRVQRALQAGRGCPVPCRSCKDFYHWIDTGRTYEEETLDEVP